MLFLVSWLVMRFSVESLVTTSESLAEVTKAMFHTSETLSEPSVESSGKLFHEMFHHAELVVSTEAVSSSESLAHWSMMVSLWTS